MSHEQSALKRGLSNPRVDAGSETVKSSHGVTTTHRHYCTHISHAKLLRPPLWSRRQWEPFSRFLYQSMFKTVLQETYYVHCKVWVCDKSCGVYRSIILLLPLMGFRVDTSTFETSCLFSFLIFDSLFNKRNEPTSSSSIRASMTYKLSILVLLYIQGSYNIIQAFTVKNVLVQRITTSCFGFVEIYNTSFLHTTLFALVASSDFGHHLHHLLSFLSLPIEHEWCDSSRSSTKISSLKLYRVHRGVEYQARPLRLTHSVKIGWGTPHYSCAAGHQLLSSRCMCPRITCGKEESTPNSVQTQPNTSCNMHPSSQVLIPLAPVSPQPGSQKTSRTAQTAVDCWTKDCASLDLALGHIAHAIQSVGKYNVHHLSNKLSMPKLEIVQKQTDAHRAKAHEAHNAFQDKLQHPRLFLQLKRRRLHKNVHNVFLGLQVDWQCCVRWSVRLALTQDWPLVFLLINSLSIRGRFHLAWLPKSAQDISECIKERSGEDGATSGSRHHRPAIGSLI